MKNWIKENYKIILLVLGFIIIGPLIINILFKLHPTIDIFVAEWDASATLSYYGTILAAILAIFGIFITIQYSQKSYKDDVRDRSMPFIVITLLKTRVHKTLFQSSDFQGETKPVEGYQEYKVKDIYCILNNGQIEYRDGLTKAQQELLDNGGMQWVSHENSRSFCVVDDICIPIEIENVGNGAAIRMSYGLNRRSIGKKDRKYLPVISLKPAMPIMFHIFSEDCSRDSANLGEYVLSFYYEDIYSNRYEQDFDIAIEYNEEKNAPVYSVDMSHVQKFIGGK